MDPAIVDSVDLAEESYENCKNEIEQAFSNAESELGHKLGVGEVDEAAFKDELAAFDILLEDNIASRQL